MAKVITYNPARDRTAIEDRDPRGNRYDLLAPGDHIECRQHIASIKSQITRCLWQGGNFDRSFVIEEMPDHKNVAPHYKVSRE